MRQLKGRLSIGIQRFILLVPMLTIGSSNSHALTTFCSNPNRERVLEAATVNLPRDNIQKLESRFDRIANVVGMTTWGVESSDRQGRVESQTIGLQSPKVSVSIEARWKPGRKSADLQVRRTCINDALEPWRGYWLGVVSQLERAGYTVLPKKRPVPQ